MATSAKLVTDLTVVLRGMRSHEGLVAGRAGQARTAATGAYLDGVAKEEQQVTARVAEVLQDLGAPAFRLRPSWAPSPVAVLASVASQTQPLGEALVVEATVLRMLADRARVVLGLATAVGEDAVVEVAAQVSALYDAYADWLVATAAVLVVDEDTAELVPSVTQRLAGRAKDAVGASARVSRQVGGAIPGAERLARFVGTAA